MTHMRPDIVKVFTASKGKEILRPTVIGAIEVTVSFVRAMNSVLILNEGPDSVYVDFDTVVGIATGFPIPAGTWWSGDVPITVIHLICNVGETANVSIIGFLLA